jgi:hypothetical protein
MSSTTQMWNSGRYWDLPVFSTGLLIILVHVDSKSGPHFEGNIDRALIRFGIRMEAENR